MSRFTHLVLCIVIVNLSNVYASEDGPNTMEQVTGIILKCAEKYGATMNDIQAATRETDVALVNSCIWGCTLQKIGFLDDKGQYVLYPGLNYVKNIIKHNEAYSSLENIAIECQKVNDQTVSDGEAGCEMGALVVACFMDKFKNVRPKA